MNQHELRFIEEQAHQLATRYGHSPSAGLGGGLASGDLPQTVEPGQ
jgi:hypothetical protein